MVRTYKAKPKIEVLCACGCGKKAVGTVRRRYAGDTCRVRAYYRRKRKENQAFSEDK